MIITTAATTITVIMTIIVTVHICSEQIHYFFEAKLSLKAQMYSRKLRN